jgi:AmpE protein
MGWLLAVLGTGVVVQALVLVIAGDSVLLTLLLHAGLLTLALAPLDILELDDEESLRETAVRIVGVVFWYLLLGPLGLIASRLCWSAARGQCWPSVSAQAAEWLWWLPVRILVLSFALVGNFHTAIEPLLRHFADSPAEMPARELVELSVPAALSPLWEDMDGSERMLQGNALLRRAMLALLVLLAIMSIF